MLSRTRNVIYKHLETRQQWRRLVRNKLVPFKLLIPVGNALHEWSRTYRDMIFEMAAFVARSGGEVTPELVRKFIGRRPRNDVVSTFSESEIGLLMRKSVAYNLPIHRFWPSSAAAQDARGPFQTEKAALAV
jgi:hypothetical protein